MARLDKVRHAAGGLSTGEIRNSMQRTMQRYATVFRTGSTLDEGCRKIGEVAESLGELRVNDRSKVWKLAADKITAEMWALKPSATAKELAPRVRRELGKLLDARELPGIEGSPPSAPSGMKSRGSARNGRFFCTPSIGGLHDSGHLQAIATDGVKAL